MVIRGCSLHAITINDYQGYFDVNTFFFIKRGHLDQCVYRSIKNENFRKNNPITIKKDDSKVPTLKKKT